jgi:hypothetical protein
MFLYGKTNTGVSGRSRFYQGGGGETNPFCQEARRRDPSLATKIFFNDTIFLLPIIECS